MNWHLSEVSFLSRVLFHRSIYVTPWNCPVVWNLSIPAELLSSIARLMIFVEAPQDGSSVEAPQDGRSSGSTGVLKLLGTE